MPLYEGHMSTDFDIIVIGAGIAGASVASHLAATHRVLLLEMEERPGYHSTGRSLATYEANYGPAPIRALTRASRREFDEQKLLSHRDSMFLVPDGQDKEFDALMASQMGMRQISLAEARTHFPLLDEAYCARIVLDPATADIDVDLLQQNFLRRFRNHGGTLVCGQAARSLERVAGQWRVRCRDHTFRGQTIINAGGAWGDRIAGLAEARLSGLQPKRRSIAVIAPPEGHVVTGWSWIGDIAENWYCKPQSGKLLVSPAEATPVEPHDAYADDLALAEGIDRFQQATGIEVTRVEHSWGGLRSFVADGCPVVGYDPEIEGFFWLIGQGGYGIQTSPALSRLAASLVRGKAVPQDIADEGLDLASISPGRLS